MQCKDWLEIGLEYSNACCVTDIHSFFCMKNVYEKHQAEVRQKLRNKGRLIFK